MWFHSPPHQINERPAELVYRRIQTILELLKNRDPDEPIHTRVQFIKSQLAEYGHNSGTYSTHTRAHAHAHTQIHTHAHTCKPKALTILSVSPLWALACFRKHFYMRLGYTSLCKAFSRVPSLRFYGRYRRASCGVRLIHICTLYIIV